MCTEATFYTIADARFFPGLVALLNSLRLTGNDGELVVLDRGLSPAQRQALEGHVRLVEIPDPPDGSPALLKAYPHMLGETGTIVLVDSDMVVGRDLGDIAELAAAGKICAFPDPVPHRGRWFAEWHEALELRAPLRQGTYLNAGFLALSALRADPARAALRARGPPVLGGRPGRPEPAASERGSRGDSRRAPGRRGGVSG
jgi:hypothetical protein